MRSRGVFFTVSVVVLLLGSLVASSASAQTVTGTLSGRVVDKSGAVMPGIKVIIKNDQVGAVREVTTNNEGYYFVPFLNIGTYEVTVAAAGFSTVTKKGLVIELNKTTVSDFNMEVSAVATVVEVTGEQPLIETTIGEIKHGLDAKAIEDTPLPGRNFISLVEQIPGFQNAPWIGSSNNPTNSTGSYAVFSGQGSRQTTFQIDGVNNDDSSENQNRQNVNVSAIKEFQVLTNAYSAEFGRAGGAVILVQTKSGTNRFHGDAYDFIQNDLFNARGYFQNRVGQNASGNPRSVKGLVRRNQYGWTIGGPLFPNKLFFFHSGERVSNVGKGSMTRFIWLPTDGPRACMAGETPAPRGPYCVDPATHPNLQRDLQFMQRVIDLWKTDELNGVAPNDPIACQDMIASGRPNRCVTISGLGFTQPDSDYSGKLDWNAPFFSSVSLRYQYSRQIRKSPRIVLGDNFGTNNNRQYNIGATATRIWSNRQTGEFRYGFGNRATLQDVTDGNTIPTIRFATVLYTAVGDLSISAGTVIGTSTNVPINRRQRDNQAVYNHTMVFSKHTFRAGIDQRWQALDDLSGDRSRGFWTFSTQNTLAQVTAGTGFAGWENFLRGFVTGYQQGYGNAIGENRFGETNIYLQDDYRPMRNLTLNLGFRWEGVRAPDEIKDRFSYGYTGDYDNYEPRIGFAWTPEWSNGLLGKITGGTGNFVLRGGYGLYHSRLFQSIFSQNQLSIRTQPPNGFAGNFSGLCMFEISDPSCGFVFTPGAASTSTEAACSIAANGCGPAGSGVKVAGGQLLTTLLLPDPKLQVPYVQQWNLTLERKLGWKTAIQVSYNGNRGIGLPFFDGVNQAAFPILSPQVRVDVGGGNFRNVIFDRACLEGSTDPMCPSGSLTSFSALTSTTATLAQKGIVITGGEPHGYVSFSTQRLNERRPDNLFSRNVSLRNFGWSYYQAMTVKLTKQTTKGLYFTGTWTLSKTIDTGSEATFTGVDVNTPTGKNNAARSLRGLSSFDARHRAVISYGYEIPFMKSQQGVVGHIFGGWVVSGVTLFQSGTPFSVAAGYDINIDGVGGDRPRLGEPAFGYTSIDNGNAQNPCPVATRPCPDTFSQLQLPGAVFIPKQVANTAAVGGGSLFITPGADGTGTIGRNTFFTDGIINFDAAFTKNTRILEGVNLQVRMEFYNLFNHVTFGVPSTSVISGTPLGRITGERNLANFVNSARTVGSRMGQFALRLTF